MSLKHVMEALDLLDGGDASGREVGEVLHARGLDEVSVRSLEAAPYKTDVLHVRVPGADPEAPVLGIVGTLGGVGARPEFTGLVSDADGAVAAVAAALKLADMRRRGDGLQGTVIVTTHICPAAPTRPHHPVPFMASPVDHQQLARALVDPRMQAVLSIDTSRGNRVVNAGGIAITPTACRGWVLRVSEDLLDLLQTVTGRPPVVLPITMQDITPYENGVFHINSIMQPATETDVPVAGLAITAEAAVPGCATGASQPGDIEQAVRFAIELAKAFGKGRCRFLDEAEFKALVARYGSMTHLQSLGRAAPAEAHTRH